MKKLICFAVIIAAMFALMGCGGGSSSSSDDPEYDTLPLAKDIDEPFWIEWVVEGYEPEFDQKQIKIFPTDNPDYIAIAVYWLEEDDLYCELIQNVKTKDIYLAYGHIDGEGENRYFAIDEIKYKLCPGKLQPNTLIDENDDYTITLGDKVNVTVKDKTYSAYIIKQFDKHKDGFDTWTCYFVPEMCYYVKVIYSNEEPLDKNEKSTRLSGRYNK